MQARDNETAADHPEKQIFLSSKDARLLVDALRWESLTSSSAPSASFASYTNAFFNLFSSGKVKSKDKKSLLDSLSMKFSFQYSSQYDMWKADIALRMLQLYCKNDNKDNPSVIFDIIIAGSIILAGIVCDKCNASINSERRRYSRPSCYPLKFDDLVMLCNVDAIEANKLSFREHLDSINGLWQTFILRLGVECLFKKSIPFNEDFIKNIAPGAYPLLLNRFDRYHLKDNKPILVPASLSDNALDSAEMWSLDDVRRVAADVKSERTSYRFADSSNR